MTNYNDGKWHVRAGMKCPVHPKSVVECVYTEGGQAVTQSAIYFSWPAITAFRVIKEHKEPREFWLINNYQHTTRNSAEAYARAFDHDLTDIIHVREVLE